MSAQSVEPYLEVLGDDPLGEIPREHPYQRIEFIKCATPWCHSNLGVRMPRGRVVWNVPVDHDYASGDTRVTCPYCRAVRVWTPKRTKG